MHLYPWEWLASELYGRSTTQSCGRLTLCQEESSKAGSVGDLLCPEVAALAKWVKYSVPWLKSPIMDEASPRENVQWLFISSLEPWARRVAAESNIVVMIISFLISFQR